MPLASTDSYIKIFPDAIAFGLPRSRSNHPLAAKKNSRHLRRPVPRSFGPNRVLNRLINRASSDPAARTKPQLSRIRWRSDKRASLRTVEVEHVLEMP
jgi:hypothetical protein